MSINGLFNRWPLQSMASSKSFSSTASRVWNKLPTHVSSALTLPVFRRHLKHHFFLDAYPGFPPPTIKVESIMPSTKRVPAQHLRLAHSCILAPVLLHTGACAIAALLTHLLNSMGMRKRRFEFRAFTTIPL